MGSGHVMRCLTLAAEFRERGAQITFITRPSTGSLLDMVRAKGYRLHVLADDAKGTTAGSGAPGTTHSQWLSVSWETDAQQTLQVLDGVAAAWLVVDQYALDARWERRMRGRVSQILVIDDLADRPHECDVLLDQNLGRKQGDYAGLVSGDTRLLLGPEHALLRAAFHAQQEHAVARREKGGQVRRILVTFGGSDRQGLTEMALRAIEVNGLGAAVDVAMGIGDPRKTGLDQIARRMPQHITFHGFDADMARLMTEADLAIGAAGSSSWERCYLGLPTIMVVVADNQRRSAAALADAGAVINLGDAQAGLEEQLIKALTLITKDQDLRSQLSRCSFAIMSQNCCAVTDHLMGVDHNRSF